jgi:hypothetical protein
MYKYIEGAFCPFFFILICLSAQVFDSLISDQEIQSNLNAYQNKKTAGFLTAGFLNSLQNVTNLVF